jgi:hypothetical protein
LNINKKKYKSIKISGEDLLSQNKLTDTYCKAIKVGVNYEIRAFYKTKSITLLSLRDWWIRDCYEIAEDIFFREGLINWVNFKIKINTFKEVSDSYEIIEGLIDCFNQKEDFDKSIYFRDELKKIKKNEK